MMLFRTPGWQAMGGLLAIGLALVLVAGSLALPGPDVAAQTATTPGVLWSAGHEGGNMSEWSLNSGGGIFNSGTGTATASTAVARSGRYSTAMTITNAGSQTQAVRLFRWAEPRQTPEAYYSTWYYFPQTARPTSWWNVFQFKSKLSSTVNDPLWILNVGNRSTGEMYFYLYDWINRRSYQQSAANVPVGRWFHLEAYYRQATNNTGQVTFWQDGVKIFDVTGVVTKRSGDEVHWSLANYTNGISPSSVTIYADDVAISTSRVWGGAPAPTATPVSPTTSPASVSPTPAPAPVANAVLADGPLAFWRLGETSGTAAGDTTGRGYHGRYVGGVALGSPGALAGDPDRSATFNGSSGYVDIPALPSTVNFTLEGWTRLNSSSVKNRWGNNTLYNLWQNVRLLPRPGSGTGFHGYWAGIWIGGVEYSLQADTANNVDRWVHWAMVRDGSRLTVYRNGQVVGNRTNLPATRAADNIRGRIGGDGREWFLHGRIDEVAVYNKALSTTQIQRHYNAALGR